MGFYRTEKGYIMGGFGDGTFGLAEELHFHTSWDWLMPVAESCFERLDVTDTSASEIQRQLSVCDKAGVYEAIVEFIKEHNRTTDYNKVTYYDGQ